MQDNALPHRAHATRDWLQNHNKDVFGPLTSKSPDMNPIENLWSQMENAIWRRQQQATNREEWANTDQFAIRRLVLSMRRRCGALVGAAGGHTKY